ncbi:MAG TPA: four helix bundle protein [Bacteroidales bacterium]|nr:four helix bundle protein [Bacteroidales bacterium]HRZ76297.1 four helix bundle protein [Bacteroidales bacterium]
MEKKYQLLGRFEHFAKSIHKVIDEQPKDAVTARALLPQLARSSLSCPLNYSEAISAESTKDFIHKLRIVLKELRETQSTLRILSSRNRIGSHKEPLIRLLKESDELIAIVYSSITTMQSKASK